MGFWTLLEVACMPTFQVLIISVLGAFMATEYWNLLPVDARRSMNKVGTCVFWYISWFLHESDANKYLWLIGSCWVMIYKKMQVVFVVFTPSLVFASVAKTITFEDIISMYASVSVFGSCFFVLSFLFCLISLFLYLPIFLDLVWSLIQVVYDRKRGAYISIWRDTWMDFGKDSQTKTLSGRPGNGCMFIR